MRSLCATALIAAAAAMSPVTGAHAGGFKAAVFDFELVDTSTEGDIDGVRDDQTRRLQHTTEQVREALQGAGGEVLDIAPAKDNLKDVKAVHDCGGCATEAAASLGADYAVVGHVQKVSNLILNINVQVIDVKTGKLVRGGSADIRGNTDESWDRGTKYLMKNNILKQPLERAG